jgi:hypothetical protein
MKLYVVGIGRSGDKYLIRAAETVCGIGRIGCDKQNHRCGRRNY